MPFFIPFVYSCCSVLRVNIASTSNNWISRNLTSANHYWQHVLIEGPTLNKITLTFYFIIHVIIQPRPNNFAKNRRNISLICKEIELFKMLVLWVTWTSIYRHHYLFRLFESYPLLSLFNCKSGLQL